MLERESQRAGQIMTLEIRQRSIQRQQEMDKSALNERADTLERVRDSVEQVLRFHQDGEQLHAHLQMFLSKWFDHLRAAMESKIKVLGDRQVSIKNRFVENLKALHNQVTQDLLRTHKLQKLYRVRMEKHSEELSRAAELEDPDLFAESQGALEKERAKVEEITRRKERLEKELTELERKDKERFKVLEVGWFEKLHEQTGGEREKQREAIIRRVPGQRLGTSEHGEGSDDDGISNRYSRDPIPI